jgi:ubiquinone/menaquinone biosynthesis C-methylase UbiE
MEQQIARPVRQTGGLRGSYDREAAHYDARRYESAEGRFFSDLETKVMLSWLALSPSSKALDVPAGTGRLTLALAGTGATVVGVDISANMLSMATAKTGDERHRIQFAQGSGASLPFADNTFDGVVSFKFFHLIPNDQKRQFIVDMARVLKPGRPLVVEFNSPYYGGVLAWLRYTFRKKHAGGMRMKCLFPDQLPVLFEGLEVTRAQGIKLPFSGALSRLVGRDAIERLNLWFGSLPVLKYLSYAIIVEARKPSTHA